MNDRVPTDEEARILEWLLNGEGERLMMSGDLESVCKDGWAIDIGKRATIITSSGRAALKRWEEEQK